MTHRGNPLTKLEMKIGHKKEAQVFRAVPEA